MPKEGKIVYIINRGLFIIAVLINGVLTGVILSAYANGRVIEVIMQ